MPMTDIIEFAEWGDFKKGDQVEVDGMKGTFFFVCYRSRAGNEWFEVVGGQNQRNVRSFPLHRVKPLGRASLGVKVRVAREARKWSRAELAKKTGLSISAIARVESKGYGSADEEFRLQEALHLQAHNDDGLDNDQAVPTTEGQGS